MPDFTAIRTFLTPRRTLFGIGAVDKVAVEAEQLGGRKTLVVTDETVERLKIADRVRGPLEEAGFEVDTWSKVEPEPTMPVADSLTEVVRAKDYELVVGVGGGSSMDMAKVAALLKTNPGDLEGYLTGRQLTRSGLPLIAIPTTSGTGSEATATFVVTYNNMKSGLTVPQAMPDVAIVDNVLAVPGRLAEVAVALGEDVSGLSEREAAYAAVYAVAQLNEDLGIPLSLEELGASKGDIPAMADEMMRITRLLAFNPRSICSDDALRLYERMWEGAF
jgi:alcohol dehydrogenase class IV